MLRAPGRHPNYELWNMIFFYILIKLIFLGRNYWSSLLNLFKRMIYDFFNIINKLINILYIVGLKDL